jgi:hypothetical protein
MSKISLRLPFRSFNHAMRVEGQRLYTFMTPHLCKCYKYYIDVAQKYGTFPPISVLNMEVAGSSGVWKWLQDYTAPFLAYFLYFVSQFSLFKKIKVGLWYHFAVCVSVCVSSLSLMGYSLVNAFPRKYARNNWKMIEHVVIYAVGVIAKESRR